MARGATVFPQAIGVASTWDADLTEAMADVIRQQMRSVGAHHALAPELDVARDARWGRVEETFGEDPYLTARMAVAYITGRTHSPGAPFGEVFCVAATVSFCCYVVALWQNWIWWGQSTRFTITYSLDGIIFALITGATFGWRWPH